jgi:hypothetical protein
VTRSVFAALAVVIALAPTQDSRISVELVPDEADAVLAILARRDAGEAIPDGDWEELFASEGYVRLKKRERSMNRSFEDDAFRKFVLSDPLLAKSGALEETLERMKAVDPDELGRRALAWLPDDARIRAKVYPAIKPQDNSFVFEPDRDPAIFLAVDPTLSRAQFENHVTHELHHIGYASCCPSKAAANEIAKLPPNVRSAITWIGAFGEGFAMLAAAGGPDVHPHAASSEQDRARWDHDVANFDADLAKVERFFLDLIDGKLDDAHANEIASSFYGVQGPWYTVGWRMAVTIVKQRGRAALFECFRDPRTLLAVFDECAAELANGGGAKLATWSPDLLARLRDEAR